MSVLIQYPAELVEGVVTRVLECGTGDKTVVCLHGAGARADRWRPVMPLLASAGYRVVAFDYPGHGFADKPADYPYGTPAFADATAALVERFDGPVTLVGTSIGGHVAAMVAVRRPELVSDVVLVGAVGLVPRQRRSGSAVLDDRSPTGIRAKLEFLLENHALITDEWVTEEARINTSPGAESAQRRLREYVAENDMLGEEYAALGIPTMICWGVEDKWVPLSYGRDLADLLPSAPFLLLSPAGHSPYFELPAEFSSAVAAFVADPSSLEPGPFGSGVAAELSTGVIDRS